MLVSDLKPTPLPQPIASEVAAFQRLYFKRFRVDLPCDEATARLTHLVQFYYLTGGHELHKQKRIPQAKHLPQSGHDAPTEDAR